MERAETVRMWKRRLVAALGSLAVVLLLLAAAVAAPAQAAAGDPDPTFSGDGKQTSDFGAGTSAATAAARQGDGKIVAVGAADGNFLVARYNLDGSLDSSFSGDGRVQTNFTVGDGARDVALQGNKIVVVGFSTDNTGTTYFALARYNPDGSLDPNFSGDGKQTTAVGAFGEGGANGVALQGDGKIVVAGSTNEFGSHTRSFALARYRLNGSLDPSFSGDGRQTTELDFGDFSRARGLAIQADGKIVAVGETSSPDDFALARFNPNGSPDMSFSGDGLQTTDFGGGFSFDGASDAAIQGDGKVVAVGGAGGDFGLARYNTNGSLDSSFSGDGLQTTDFLFGAGDSASDVAIQANGRIVVAGGASGGATGSDFGLARYNTNGSLDTSFSADGRKRTSFGGSDNANGVALQGDGRIVAVGAGNGEVALARFLGS